MLNSIDLLVNHGERGAQAVHENAVDNLIDAYVDWREECLAVAHTAWSYKGSYGRRAGDAYFAYRAALDREESAAAEYEAWTIRVRLLFADS